MYKKQENSPKRCGAALMIVIVLLAFLGIISGMALPQILRDRQESQRDLVQVQSRQLSDDAIRSAEAKREADPEFSGETLTLGPDSQPYLGTFQVTSRLDDNAFVAEVEYRDENGRIVITQKQPQQEKL